MNADAPQTHRTLLASDPRLVSMKLGLGLFVGLAVACEVDAPKEEAAAPLVHTVGNFYDGRTLPAGTISLTYDDGPGENTLAIAQYLHGLGIQATFFVNGCRFVGAPPATLGNCADEFLSPYFTRHPTSDLGQLVALGHRVANHTQDHVGLGNVYAADPCPPNNSLHICHNTAFGQIRPLQTMLNPYQGDGLGFIRAGGGNWSAAMARALNLQWDLRHLRGQAGWIPTTDDYLCLRTRSIAQCAADILATLPAGPTAHGIILLHDREHALFLCPDATLPGCAGGVPSAERRAATLRLTQAVVPALLARGYRFVPLDAVPGLLGPRRFIESGLQTWTTSFGDHEVTGTHASFWRSFRLADINGDGAADVCARGLDGLYCAYSRAPSGSASFGVAVRATPSFSDAEGYRSLARGPTLMFGDLDADGDADACMRRTDGIYCAFAQPGTNPRFSRAGRWTTAFSDAENYEVSESLYGSLRLGDVNGDGRADLCARSPTGVVCALNQGLFGFGPVEPWLTGSFTDAEGYRSAALGASMQLGDIDGDGWADVCFRGPTGMRCALNHFRFGGGRRFAAPRDWTQGPFSNQDGFDAADKWPAVQLANMNGDADADVCGRAATGLVCAFASGGEFIQYQYLMNTNALDTGTWRNVQHGATFRFADIDGDGDGDVCARGPAGVVCARGDTTLTTAP